jgi:hypothetical protein
VEEASGRAVMSSAAVWSAMAVSDQNKIMIII